MRGLALPGPIPAISCGGRKVGNVAMSALRQHPQSAVGPQRVGGGDEAGGSGAAAGAAADGAAPAAAVAPRRARNTGKFRFWHDERRFKGPADRCIVQQALFDCGGVRTGGYPKAAPLPGPLGFQRPADWDFLWSPARTALKAVPVLKPGQLVSALPGMMSVTKKRRLSVTLKRAYGPEAFELVPLTFSLPSEAAEWRAWLDAEAAAGRDPGPWMLKTAQHLGMGLCLLPGEQAYSHAEQPRLPAAKPWVLAQRYVADPLLIDGRKFGVRLWVLVTGTSPLRAYLSDRGLVLFSTEGYDADSLTDDGEGEDEEDGMMAEVQQGEQQQQVQQQQRQQQVVSATDGAAGRGHVTNYAQNVDGTVWDLGMLRKHMGDAAYDALWAKLVHSAARVAAAALPEALSEGAKLRPPPNSTFELLGLDYLIDSSGHPWLLEVNGTPSLAVEHSDPAVEALIHTQKAGMVRDMVSLLGCATRFDDRYTLLRAAVVKDKAAAKALRARAAAAGGDDASFDLAKRELAARGGFLPLVPFFPLREAYDRGYGLPWGPRDYHLRDWMDANPEAWRQAGRQQQRQQGGGAVAAVAGGAAARAQGVSVVADGQQQQQQQQQREEEQKQGPGENGPPGGASRSSSTTTTPQPMGVP